MIKKIFTRNIFLTTLKMNKCQRVYLCDSADPDLYQQKEIQKTTLTAAGFEPAPFRTGA